MVVVERAVKRVLTGQFREGEDLIQSLQDLVEKERVHIAKIEIIGAVSRAKVGFFNYKSQEYEFSKYRRPMNIVSCIGDVTTEGGIPIVHLHISLADHDGGMFGGHLFDETTILSADFYLTVYE